MSSALVAVACEKCHHLATPGFADQDGWSWTDSSRVRMAARLGCAIPAEIVGVGLCRRCADRSKDTMYMAALIIAIGLTASACDRFAGGYAGWVGLGRSALVFAAGVVVYIALGPALRHVADALRPLMARRRLRRFMRRSELGTWPVLEAWRVAGAS